MMSENTNLSKIVLIFLILLSSLLFVIIRGCKDITKFICHLTLFINHPYVKFDSDRSRESEFITFFICHVTLCDHVINRLCDFMDNRPTLKPTSLSRLVAMVTRKLKYNVFHLSNDSMDGGHLL